MKKSSNDYGIASLVLGISSVIFCWIPLVGMILGILGIIFYAQQRKGYKNGIATGGLVTGIIGLFFSVLWTLLWIAIIEVII